VTHTFSLVRLVRADLISEVNALCVLSIVLREAVNFNRLGGRLR
jgi:hypothetical protein